MHLWHFLFYQVVAETVEMVELSILETEFPTDSDPQTEAVLHGKEHVCEMIVCERFPTP